MRTRPFVVLGIFLACTGESDEAGTGGSEVTGSAATTSDASTGSDVTAEPTTGDSPATTTTEPTGDVAEYCGAWCGKFVDCFGSDGPDDEAMCVSNCTGTVELGLDPACLPQWKEYMECILDVDCAAFENPSGSACSPLLAGWNNEACTKES